MMRVFFDYVRRDPVLATLHTLFVVGVSFGATWTNGQLAFLFGLAAFFGLLAIFLGVLGSTPLGSGQGQLASAQTLGVTLSGTITTATEAAIVLGGRTIILTVTGDTWVAAGAAFDAQRQAIINGLDSGQAEPLGWDAVVKAGLAVTAVVRTSNTVVTITLPAFAAYDILTAETITATVPGAALTGAVALVASPTFGITPTGVLGVARHINNRMENYLLDAASVAYSNPQSPLLGIVDPTVNNITANITYYLNNNAVAQGANPLLSTRGGRLMGLINAAAGS